MTDAEIRIIIAFLFKRSGKEELSLSELYLPLSMDMKWFSPKQARELVNSALQQKLLTKKGELVKPNFDYKNVVVPVGFHPSKQPLEEKESVVKEEKRDVVKTLIERIVKKTGLAKQHIVEKITETEKERNISPGVAALLVSREYDIDVTDCFDEIEDKIFRENRE